MDVPMSGWAPTGEDLKFALKYQLVAFDRIFGKASAAVQRSVLAIIVHDRGLTVRFAEQAFAALGQVSGPTNSADMNGTVIADHRNLCGRVHVFLFSVWPNRVS